MENRAKNDDYLALTHHIELLLRKLESTPEGSKDKEKIISEILGIITISVSQKIERIWSAPIPPPSHLAAYEEICPGAAKKILNRAEKQSDHRISIEADTIKSNNECRVRAQHYSLITVIIVFIVVIFSMYFNYPWVAGALGLGDIALLASIFYQKESNIKEEIRIKKEKETKDLIE